jgi:DNA-binding response OmpR family regulator
MTAGVDTPSRHIRLLIVDDDVSLTAMLALHLLEGGFTVARTDRCERARRLFKPGAFDVALLDYRLPDGSGLELGQELRRADPGIGLVLMSGCTESGLAGRVSQSGFQTFLGKPFPTSELDAALSDETLNRTGVPRR